jgi:hypothetical protein
MLSNLEAQEFIYSGRSAKGLLMGDAYTSLANDDYTLFYNAAVLSENKGIEIYPINPSISFYRNFKDYDIQDFEDLDEDRIGKIVDDFMGMALHLSGQFNPTFKLGNFGMSLIFNPALRLNLRNSTHPTAEFDVRFDKGFVVGYAFNFKSKEGQTSVGLSAKFLSREGLKEIYDIFNVSTYEVINDSECKEECIKNHFNYSKGKGVGFDLGILHLLELKNNTQIRFGLSILDIGDTTFSLDSGSVPSQDMMVNLGFAYSYRYGIANWAFSLDLHPLNQSTDFGRIVHLGLDMGIDILQVMAGFNGGYFSGGLELDLKFIRIVAGLFDIEVGGGYRNQKSERAVIYLDLFETKF